MKRAIIFLIFLNSLTLAYGQSPRKVAILPVLDKANSFDGTEGYAKKLMLRMSLHAAISSNEGFIPLDRTDFSVAMNEASFQRSGSVSDEEIRAIGEQYGATHVLIAEIAKIDAERMVLSAKITNVQTSASKAAPPTIVSQDPAKMPEVCMKLAKSLLDEPRHSEVQQNQSRNEVRQNNNRGESTQSTSGMDWVDSKGRRGMYIGSLLNGVPHGKGKILYVDGLKIAQYDGEFVNGKKHGKGVDSYVNGKKYEGEFRDDLRHGKGIDYYANGNRYEGDFKNDVRSGKGIYYYADGSRYEGDWEDDKKHGYGTHYYANCDYEAGRYNSGKKEGIHYKYRSSGSFISKKKY